jgi:PhnB protein
MSDNFAPEGWHTVTPRIVTEDAKGLVTFVKNVFGAAGEYRDNVPSEITIGDSIVMITAAGVRAPMSAFLYVYVADADAAYRRALDAGAHSVEAPVDTPYGDHRCMVEDRWGNTWQIANRIR